MEIEEIGVGVGVISVGSGGGVGGVGEVGSEECVVEPAGSGGLERIGVRFGVRVGRRGREGVGLVGEMVKRKVVV